MYKTVRMSNTTLVINKSTEGETIEQKIARIMSNKEPIKDGAPLIYTERKDGVQPQYDIRTDRFEIAVDASDKIAKSYKARREDRINKAKVEKEKDGGTEPIQGKEETSTTSK